MPNTFLTSRGKLLGLALFCVLSFRSTSAGERTLVQLIDFTVDEVKAAGFILPSDARVHIVALGGGGGKGLASSSTDLYAYGWIIDADTRKLVWSMDVDNTKKEKDDRKFDGELFLPKGNYEIYFAAYGFAMNTPFRSFNFNVDRRKKDFWITWSQPHGWLSWLQEFFGGEPSKEWHERVKHWGIELSIPDDS